MLEAAGRDHDRRNGSFIFSATASRRPPGGRQEILDAAYAGHPERFRSQPITPKLSGKVRINKPRGGSGAAVNTYSSGLMSQFGKVSLVPTLSLFRLEKLMRSSCAATRELPYVYLSKAD